MTEETTSPAPTSALVPTAPSGLSDEGKDALATQAHDLAVQMASNTQDRALARRFGQAWTRYRSNVPRWLPRLRPWRHPALPPAEVRHRAEREFARREREGGVRRGEVDEG